MSSSSLRVDIQSFDGTQELNVGTSSILRHFSSRIQEDFVLLPCDFIPPPTLPLSKLLNKFRSEAASDGAIATGCWFESPKSEKSAAPDEWGSHSQACPIVWDDRTGTLLYIDTLDDTDKNAEELELRMNLLSRYPRPRLSSKLYDSHVYVCKHEVLDVLHRKTGLDSLREDFFPWLCKVHYQATKRSKYGRGTEIFSLMLITFGKFYSSPWLVFRLCGTYETLDSLHSHDCEYQSISVQPFGCVFTSPTRSRHGILCAAQPHRVR